jgi:pimeloyl-ACP methyl ester carboxylesterase
MPGDPPRLYVHELPPASGADGPLVVLVHGSMDRHRSFLRLRARLRSCHVVIYDRRGYERSRAVRPPAAGVADHASDLAGVLRGRPAVLLGHSYGGVVALALAAARPDLVRAAVVYEAPIAWSDWWDAPSGRSGPAAGRAQVRRWDYEGMDPGDAAEAFVRRMIGDRRYERLSPSTRGELRADGPALVTELMAIRRDPAPFDPAAIHLPVIVGRGALAIERHVRGGAWLARNLANAELVVLDGAEHGAHLSHSRALAGLVLRALARLGIASGGGDPPTKRAER